MKHVLYLIAALMCGGAVADGVASNGKDSVRITGAPCPAAIVAMVPEQVREFVRAAFAKVDGKSYSACWIVRGDFAHLLYEDGDQGLIPLRDFRNEPGV